jgi:hypothetical protein
MHVTLMRTAVPMLLALTPDALSFAGEFQQPPASSAPSIEGTYRLISRRLPDSTMLRPPAIEGLNRIRRATEPLTLSGRTRRANSSPPPTCQPTRWRPPSTARPACSASETTRSLGRKSFTTFHRRPAAHPSQWRGGVSSSRTLLVHVHSSSKETRWPRAPRATLTCGKRLNRGG